VADVWYPQTWVEFEFLFENYISSPPVLPQPVLPNGDPVDKGGFVSVNLKIVPENCSVTFNSYRLADTARITIPYGRLPIDPRLLRRVGVKMYMGSLDPDDYVDSMGALYGEGKQILLPRTSPDPDPNIPQPNPVGSPFQVSNEVFRGFVDEWEVLQDGNDLIQMTARDLTAGLIDAEMPISGLAGIPKDLPIDQVIEAVIKGDITAGFVPPDNREERASRIDARRNIRLYRARLESLLRKQAKVTANAATDPVRAAAELLRLSTQIAATQAIVAEVAIEAGISDKIPLIAQRYGLVAYRNIKITNATGEDLPTLGQVKGASYFDSNGNAKRAKNGGGNKRISYWDFVTDICVGVGLICYLKTPTNADGTIGGQASAEIVIDRPNTYYRKPGDAEKIRRYSYGENVDSLSIQRNYEGLNIPTGVAVSAIEAKTGNHISTRYPPVTTKKQEPNNRPGLNPAGLGDRAEYRSIVLDDRIPGDNAVATLKRKAKSLYEQLSRGEFIVEVNTTSLSAFPDNRGKSVPDIFQLRAGTPIEIDVVPSLPVGADGADNPLVTTAGDWWAKSPQGRVQYLTQVLGIDLSIAFQIAKASSSPLLQNVFYVREVGIDFDAGVGGGGGFNITIQALNYLDARDDQDVVDLGLMGGRRKPTAGDTVDPFGGLPSSDDTADPFG